MKKRKVLVMVDWYAPGFKAGGPIRSAVNFADQLEEQLDIFVFTTDRDLGDQSPYREIKADQWIIRNNHQVFYASPSFLNWENIRQIFTDVVPDHVYLNSMFSRYFTIYPLLMKRFGMLNSKILLAPRGMLRESALVHKALKKKLFINLLKYLNLSNSLTFQATDETEENDIREYFGNNADIIRAGNLPGKMPPFQSVLNKQKGFLEMVFVGRIHPIKNPDFLLRVLNNPVGNINLTIIATIEDQQYWEACKLLIASLPSSVKVKLMENVPHEHIEQIIQKNHVFVLPTKGENFGHAVYEALAAGRPVLISDQTPWRNLTEKKAGWDLPLTDENAFLTVINQLVHMDNVQLNEWCTGAWSLANRYVKQNETRGIMLSIFNTYA